MVGVFVLLLALVLWGVQGDCSLLEAIYFCFSSLSTIGLGDLLRAAAWPASSALPPLPVGRFQVSPAAKEWGGREEEEEEPGLQLP